MSNNHGSRHMACKTCRERKVRCDGGQPTCQKCERAGVQCVYVPASKQTKAELAESLEIVQERLARTEAALVSQRVGHGQPTSPVHPPPSPVATDYAMISRHPLSSNTNFLWSNAMPFTTNPSIDSHTSFSFPPEDGTFGSIVGEVPSTDALSSTAPYTVYPNTGEQGRVQDPEVRRDACVSPLKVPSRREIMEWHAAQQTSQQSNSEPSSTATPNRGDFLNHFTVFAKVVSSTSADVAGVALTVADYLAWASKNPGECHESLLEILEARMREIAEIVTNRIVGSLEGIAASQTELADLKNMAKSLEAITAKEGQEKAEYFRTAYDVQSSLGEQRGQAEGLA